MEGKSQMDIFDNVSPVDYRYPEEKLRQFLSEGGFTRHKIFVEVAVPEVLTLRRACDPNIFFEIQNACKGITTEEVYEEEGRIGHDIRALVNCIQARVSDKAKPFVHIPATSFDIIDTANALRFKGAIQKVLLPALIDLEKTLILIADREADTIQIGRTHLQHAVPITFGFAIASYVSRLGNCILSLQYLTEQLVGKFSGATGSYNASSLFFKDPEDFEKEVLTEAGVLSNAGRLKPAEISTQIVPPEPMIRVFSETVLIGGVMANLSRDMRNLQRTEIGEVGEEFATEQVGSSTMPQKRNPINFENVESLWKVLLGRLVTFYLDQISDHQRDLTNSASGRTYSETISYITSMARRLNRTMKKLKVDKNNMERNLNMQGDLVLAEPLQIILAGQGHPTSHEKVRMLTLRAQAEKKSLVDLARSDPELEPYFDAMTAYQKAILSDPYLYTGIAAVKARKVADRWAEKLGIEYKNI